ncbi:hypothetical protein LC087_18085 [Bacillus carboniphilus]|uniref:Uncharacterized protein n=1 Tax=Bacillus carboniphilus TaxID=86663 RepID=A0ABY9JVQ2_9BACI|nr:hypothetical protein [Bacillus carboniphilus]WLR42568.1 hypothetical protein LC087_18085 [Bacillus carboniphilus]
MIKEQDTFTWEIGHDEELVTIEETEENKIELQEYRDAVEDVNTLMFKVILLGLYNLIVIIVATIILKKNKRMSDEGGGLIIGLYACWAFYHTFEDAIDLSTAFKNAKLFYWILTN